MTKYADLSTADPWRDASERFYLAPLYHQVADVIGWGAAVEIGMHAYYNRRPPSRENANKCGFLPVPVHADTRVAREIADVVGADAMRKLIDAFGGEVLQFGSIEPASTPRRNRAIVERLEDGGKIAVVACAFGLTERTIRWIYQGQTGKPFNRMDSRNQELTA